jgi:hypothetical protein
VYCYTQKYTYTSVPISLSLLFITHVSKNFSTYIGLGIGHYFIRIEEDWTHQSPWYGTENGTEVDKFKDYAPHINFGNETIVRLAVFSKDFLRRRK